MRALRTQGAFPVIKDSALSTILEFLYCKNTIDFKMTHEVYGNDPVPALFSLNHSHLGERVKKGPKRWFPALLIGWWDHNKY